MRETLPDYPWDAMAPYARRAEGHPDGAINLSVGSPVDPTPETVRRALDAATDAHAYPATTGSPALREAIAAWYLRRRGVKLTASHVLPTVGSKELVALLPFLLGLGKDEAVVFPTVAYPTYEMGAALTQSTAVASDNASEWPENTKLVWLNSPANPTGRVASIEELQAAVLRARELGAVIASDECYAELGWEDPYRDAPTPSILDPRVIGDDFTNVLSVYSLSKQSNLAGYRAAFVAGDRDLIDRLLTVRKHAGLMSPAPVQAAMVAALNDDKHVVEQRERYRARRDTLHSALVDAGFRIDHSEAGLYLWLTAGEDAWDTVSTFADLGIIIGPGTFYGSQSSKHVRISLTASDRDIARAAGRIRDASIA